ncbi:MAG: GNAT family N-acetyltransferase [Thermodesulfobacteriota bacterium]
MDPMRPSITLREIVAAPDVERIGSLVAGTGFFSGEEIGIARELVEERLAQGPACGYHFLLAETGQALLGYTCYGPTDDSPWLFDLYWIAVHDSCRGKGIGSALLAATERRVARMGGRRIHIETSSRPQYLPTRRFYEKHGYRKGAVHKNFYAPGEDRYVYVKDLAPAQPVKAA